jgi:hypothetical protein
MNRTLPVAATIPISNALGREHLIKEHLIKEQ